MEDYEHLCMQYDPFYGRSEGVKVIRDKMVTTQSSRDCCICFQKNVAGERGRVQTVVMDGRLRNYTMCNLCCRAMAESWSDDGDAIEERTSLGKRAQSAIRNL